VPFHSLIYLFCLLWIPLEPQAQSQPKAQHSTSCSPQSASNLSGQVGVGQIGRDQLGSCTASSFEKFRRKLQAPVLTSVTQVYIPLAHKVFSSLLYPGPPLQPPPCRCQTCPSTSRSTRMRTRNGEPLCPQAAVHALIQLYTGTISCAARASSPRSHPRRHP
jgi:hypothetical protein